ncbi:MAG: toxin-antitoxin system YwqK family antitoxin [Shewanella sp.]
MTRKTRAKARSEADDGKAAYMESIKRDNLEFLSSCLYRVKLYSKLIAFCLIAYLAVFFEYSIHNAIASTNGPRVHKVDGITMYSSNNTPFTGRVLYFYERRFFQKSSIINYKNGLPHGEARFYAREYTIKSDEGRQLNHTVGGHLTTKVYFLHGQENGIVTSYYPNGRVWRETTYINGKKEGVERFYFDKIQFFSKKLKSEHHYNNNKENGIEKRYDEKGVLREEIPWLNGERDGIAKKYYENGALQYETRYNNGKYIGLIRSYYPNGDLEHEYK